MCCGHEDGMCGCVGTGETPIHVTPWGFLGESWPYFRPNFTNIEEQKVKYSAEEVGRTCKACVSWLVGLGVLTMPSMPPDLVVRTTTSIP